MEGGDWNVEKYHNKFEPDEQWELKRKFMEAHKSHMSEERVVCLAQVLVNMEFLGTRYPEETMRTVAELSQGIIEEFRERQKTRLQRTFVGGSDAASAKVKDSGRIAFVKASNTLGKDNPERSESHKSSGEAPGNVPPANQAKVSTHSGGSHSLITAAGGGSKTGPKEIDKKKNSNRKLAVEADGNKDLVKKSGKNKRSGGESIQTVDLTATTAQKRKCPDTKETATVDKRKTTSALSGVCSKFPTLVLVMLERDLPNPPAANWIVKDSARLSRIPMTIQHQVLNDGKTWESTLIIAEQPFMQSIGSSKKSSENSVMTKAFEELKRTNFQLIITHPSVTSIPNFFIDEDDQAMAREDNKEIPTVSRDFMKNQSANTRTAVEDEVKSSLALKMMKKMGWTGAGLGSQEQGITKPIHADVVVGRSGLGFKGSDGMDLDSAEFSKRIRHYLQEYIRSNSVHKLIFSSEYSLDERKTIHTVARKMGLFSKSIGSKGNRQLTVRRAAPQCRPLIEWVDQLRKTESSDPIFTKIRLIAPTG